MRLSIVSVSLAAVLLGPAAARACEPAVHACLSDRVTYPAYTAEGLRVGTVEARVRHFVPLERSRFTGQPLPVVFNNPGSLPGAIDPYVELVPLPRARPFDTQAVYPRGY